MSGPSTHVRRPHDDSADARDPLLGGPPAILVTPWDTFTLDSTTFMHHGTRYLVWAQHEPGIDTSSNLYIAPLASPTSSAARQ